MRIMRIACHWRTRTGSSGCAACDEISHTGGDHDHEARISTLGHGHVIHSVAIREVVVVLHATESITY
jgi:hypothetical protein